MTAQRWWETMHPAKARWLNNPAWRKIVDTLVPVYGMRETQDGAYRVENLVAVGLDEAELITSEVAGQKGDVHKIAIDLDMPAVLVPSSTEGHFHLIIDHPIAWQRYVEILEALDRAGVVEHGYVEASKRRGFSALRVPWITKHSDGPHMTSIA